MGTLLQFMRTANINMIKKLLVSLLIGLGLPILAFGAVNLPTTVIRGDMLFATSTSNLIRINCIDGKIIKWASGIPTCATDQSSSGGGATTTITSNIISDGPDFIFATSSATGLNLNISGSGSTITFNPQLQSGYNIPLTASTTNWNTAYGWGNHATAGYLTASALVPYLTTTTAASTYQPIGSYLTGTKVDSFNTRTGAVTLTSGDVTGALTFTPYNATNPNNYIALTALSGTSPISYNNGTGAISCPTCLTGNQTITLSGDVTGSGATSITTAYNTIVPISKGGTGTSTAPTFGKLLMGNAGGTYDLVATSSLGITGGGAYNVISANGLISVSTTTALATLTASTSPNFTAVSATNASTTNLTVATNIYLPGVSNCNSSQYLQITSGIFGCGTPAGGGGSLSGGTTGKIAVWASSTALTTGLLLDDGTVSGVNATSTGTTFFVKGSVGDKPFVVASSTGTALITVLPSGYTGIGYNNPQAPLEVKNTTSGVFNILRLQTSGNAGSTGVLSFANTVAGGPTTGVDVSSIGNYVSNGTYATYATDMLFNTSYNGSFNVQKMILSAEGRLGIGTSSPVGMLTVQGTTTTANLPLFVVASSTNLQLFTVGSNGSVGIGTTTNYKLSVQGTAGVNPFNVSSSTGVSLFYVGANGRVGIGSSSPSATLTIDSNTAINTASSSITIPQKFQIETYNSAGTKVCLVIVGTTPTVITGACP